MSETITSTLTCHRDPAFDEQLTAAIARARARRR